ncbi:MAG: aminoglycoside phosphotransferase family protein [Acidobacteria bacterium]|nr:aminoglycoside phosphotransferase family protein [Acidobacteriota bacterium]
MLVEDACKLIPRETVELLASDRANGRIVVEAWLQALNGNWKSTDQGGVFVASLFQAYFDSLHHLAKEINHQFTLRTTQTGARHSRQGSWFEATRRLAGTLFHLGRLGEPTAQKQKWLSKVVELTGYLLANGVSVGKPANAIRCYGFRGVSCALLARSATDPAKYYEEAAECLQRSRNLGDVTLENGQYLVESYLHLLELRKEQVWLTKAETVLREVQRDSRAARRAFTLSGEVRIQKGFASLMAEQPDKAFQGFTEAEAYLTRALAMPADPMTDDAYVLRVLGLSRYMLFTTAARLGQPTLLEKLDGVIADLETRQADGKLVGSGGITLPNALFIRARLYREAEDLPRTQDFLGRAYRTALEAPAAEELIRSIRVTQCALEVEATIASGNPAKIVEAFYQLYSFRTTGKIPLAPLAHAARTVIKLDSSHGDKLAADFVAEADSVLATHELEPGARQFTASHAGGLALYVARKTGSPDDFLRAYAFYRVALEERLPDTAAETFGLAGDTALRLAKLLIADNRDDDAEGYLQDAIANFSDALLAFANPDIETSDTFKEVVTHSKLGECALRLNALNGGLSLVDKAIESFEKSKQLGNDSAALVGLLGDAFYRRGRYNADIADLRRCVDLKKAARSGSEANRENLSVSARVHFQIGELTGETGQYREGLILLGETLRCDPDWPWPLFQMLELAQILSRSLREEIVAGLSNDTLPSRIQTAFEIADENVFFDHAIGCVLRNKEFERMRLGGRQDVYVVDDPHRLLSESYVFKHTPRANAERDQRTILGFRQFLEGHNSPRHFGLPEPLRIATLSGNDAVYLMRKANGAQLGRLVIQHIYGRRSNPKPHFVEALHYLAYFHAWNDRRTGPAVRHILTDTFQQFMDISLARRLAAEFPPDWPLVRKKDAHPENWLLERSGKIIMLDFEATSPCPLLLDAVQLLDDYPLLGGDGSGWQERIEMVSRYLQQLEELGYMHDLNAQMVERAYAALATFRCAFGLRHQHREHENALSRDSMSALKAIRTRVEHYRNLLGYLSRSAPGETIRQIAGAMLEVASKKTTTVRRPRGDSDEQQPEAFS